LDPSILRIYHRDKEAFWAAVVAPLLSKEYSLVNCLHHLKADIELLNGFKDNNDSVNLILREFSAHFSFDLIIWKSELIKLLKSPTT
jgi:hypothetical protein